MCIFLNNNFVLPGYASGGLKIILKKEFEGATFSFNISLRINRRYIKMEKLNVFFVIYLRVNR